MREGGGAVPREGAGSGLEGSFPVPAGSVLLPHCWSVLD